MSGLAVALVGAFLWGQKDVAKVPDMPITCSPSMHFAIDSDGSRLACLSQTSPFLRIWSGDSPEPVELRITPRDGTKSTNGGPASLAIDPPGKHAVLFRFNGRAQVWDVARPEAVQDLPCNRKRLTYSRFSPNGRLLGAVSNRQKDTEEKVDQILFWSTEDWSEAGSISTGENVRNICFSPDGGEVIACVGHPTDQKNLGFTGIISWDVETKKETGRMEYGTGFPIRIAVSPDARWVATGGGDAVPVSPNERKLSGHLRVFDWREKKFLAELYTIEDDYVRSVSFSTDGYQLYGSDYSKMRPGLSSLVRAFSTKDWAPSWTARVPGGVSSEFIVSPRGKSLLVPNLAGLHVVNAADGTVLGKKLHFER